MSSAALVIALVVGAALLSRRSDSAMPEASSLVPIRFAPEWKLDARAELALAEAVRESSAPRITSAFRDRSEQERLYALWLAGKGNLAAKPGSSFHELGLALDARGTPDWEAAMSRHGWRRTVSSEPWHWEFRP